VQVSPEFNQAGNILIADQWNNRVIEVNPSGRIIWSFGLGPLDFSSNSPISVNDAERIGDYTLMANPGDAPGVIPQTPNGSVDNRVILVDPAGKVVWQYGQFGQTGNGPNLLNTPVQCTFVPDFNVLITDQGNSRIIEVNYNKEIIWQYPGADTNAADQLNAPNSAELLADGHILIADQGNSRALEVTSAGQIVKTFTAGGTVNILAFASRLANGDTLITDAGNARIVEVNAEDHVVWQYFTTNNAPNSPAGSMSVASPQPTRAVRLANGDTLISDQLNNRVIRVNHAGKITADYGLPLPLDGGTFSGGSAGILIGNNFGYGLYSTQEGFYSPYDAKVIGDYTGLTPPLAK
jgi:outer membrane protein assembly factor BamB